MVGVPVTWPVEDLIDSPGGSPVADQVYGGASGEDTLVTRAVRETRGEIITYQGEPIIAYYSSTCGGRTAAVEEVWPWRNGRPYLQSRSDMMPDGQTAYCQASNRYRWNVTWTGDSLRHVLQQTLATRANNPQLVVSRKDLAVATLAELVAWVKANQGKVSAGTAGVGSASHIGGIYFQKLTGTSFVIHSSDRRKRLANDGEIGKFATPLRYEIVPRALSVLTKDGSTQA